MSFLAVDDSMFETPYHELDYDESDLEYLSSDGEDTVPTHHHVSTSLPDDVFHEPFVSELPDDLPEGVNLVEAGGGSAVTAMLGVVAVSSAMSGSDPKPSSALALAAALGVGYDYLERKRDEEKRKPKKRKREEEEEPADEPDGDHEESKSDDKPESSGLFDKPSVGEVAASAAVAGAVMFTTEKIEYKAKSAPTESSSSTTPPETKKRRVPPKAVGPSLLEMSVMHMTNAEARYPSRRPKFKRVPKRKNYTKSFGKRKPTPPPRDARKKKISRPRKRPRKKAKGAH